MSMSTLSEFALAWNNKAFYCNDPNPLFTKQLADTIADTFGAQRYHSPVSVSKLYKPMAFLIMDKLSIRNKFEAVPREVTPLWMGNAYECLVMALLHSSEVPYHSYQRAVTYRGIPGKIDFMVTTPDGDTVVDIKSMSPYYYNSFVSFPNDDRGYITQILAYREALGCSGSAILCVCKQTGKMALVNINREDDYERAGYLVTAELIEKRTAAIAQLIQKEHTVADIPEYPVEYMVHILDGKTLLMLPSIKYDSRAQLFFRVNTSGIKEIYDRSRVAANLAQFLQEVV